MTEPTEPSAPVEPDLATGPAPEGGVPGVLPGPEPVPAAGHDAPAVPDHEPAADTPPTPRPTPGPRPRVPAPRPQAPTPRALPHPPHPVPHPPATPAHEAQEAAEAAAWGRVDDDGTVWVRETAGERRVGQYAGADTSEALAFYVRRFLDLQAQVTLLETRLPHITTTEAEHTLATLAEATAEPAAVGDLDGLRARLDVMRAEVDTQRAAAQTQRRAARERALQARTVIVEAAEQIAATDPARTQWRQSGERLRELLEEWKSAQRHGPRLDRDTEDALWKRFAHARSAFDRARRQHFAEIGKRRTEVKAVKEQIVVEAEHLASSTDWAATAASYRTLMERWKAAGRTAPRDDDALWARFRAAQDTFFAARSAAHSATDREYADNLTAKLALLEEAERLVPVTDLARARTALRSVQERWDALGKVPREDVARVEGRLRAVEQAVRDAQQQTWQRSNPETRARAEGALVQLESSIAALESELAAAQQAEDTSAAARARSALETRRAWLAQIRRTADDSR